MKRGPAGLADFGDSLVIDLGTSAAKAAVLDATGEVLAQAARPLTTRTASGGVMEQDAEQWWEAAGDAVRELAAGGATRSVRRVIVTGQMQDLTLTNETGAPLLPTLLYGDVRAVREADEALAMIGAARLPGEVGEATGRGAGEAVPLPAPWAGDAAKVHGAGEAEVAGPAGQAGAAGAAGAVGPASAAGAVSPSGAGGAAGANRAAASYLRALAANDLDPSGFLPKLLWLRRHEPEVLQRATRLFLGAADVLVYRLTGEHVCDTTTASTTGLMALDTRTAVPDEVFAALGLPDVPARLPRFVAGGARAGVLGPKAASAWNLPADIPVYIAPGDGGATTVGAGSGEVGNASGYVGTSGWVSFSSDVRGDPATGVFTLAHPAPGRTIHIAPLLTAGGNLAWAAAAIGDEADYDDLIERAMARPPARLLYLPYLQGERSPFRDPFARGAFIGLGPNTTRDDLVRAVLEGVAFAYRHALAALLPSGHASTYDLVLTGGGTRSAAWCRLFATVLGRTVLVPSEPDSVGLRGALRCVQVAEGVVDDYALGVQGDRFAPDDTLRGAYDDLFASFRGAHRDLRGLYDGLARSRGHLDSLEEQGRP